MIGTDDEETIHDTQGVQVFSSCPVPWWQISGERHDKEERQLLLKFR